MPVKHWGRAGLMLTDWCNAACACCYACCGPAGQTWMSLEEALRVWQGLVQASPHGCRVHLTGGEAFGRYDHLLAVCQAAARAGLGPLEAVETNGFWAADEALVRRRLAELSAAGMGRLTVSADPYHQQFVPIDRVRALARVAGEVLGSHRVRIRWTDWLSQGFNTDNIPAPKRRELFAQYAAAGRDRITGRAAWELGGLLALKPLGELDDNPCGDRLLRSRGVHVAPTGEVWLATCIGVAAGNALNRPVASLWRELADGWARHPVIGPLSQSGPVGLLASVGEGFVPNPSGYHTKCHLCFELRRHLARRRELAEWIGPGGVYGLTEPAATET